MGRFRHTPGVCLLCCCLCIHRLYISEIFNQFTLDIMFKCNNYIRKKAFEFWRQNNQIPPIFLTGPLSAYTGASCTLYLHGFDRCSGASLCYFFRAPFVGERERRIDRHFATYCDEVSLNSENSHNLCSVNG